MSTPEIVYLYGLIPTVILAIAMNVRELRAGLGITPDILGLSLGLVVLWPLWAAIALAAFTLWVVFVLPAKAINALLPTPPDSGHYD